MKNVFNDIYKQEYANKILSNQLNCGKISHAYLFIGNDLDILEDCAKDFGNFVLSYTKNKKQTKNFDLKIFKPNGINSYLLSQIKDIISDSNFSPMHNNKKIYIIHDAEKLSSSCANAFLKTLEEPPDFNMFILLAKNLYGVLDTIISRCQIVQFKNLNFIDKVNILSAKTNKSLEVIERALNICNGNLKTAHSFILNQDVQNYFFKVKDIFIHLTNLSYKDMFIRIGNLQLIQKEILDKYKSKLDLEYQQVQDLYDKFYLETLEQQNKRNYSSKEKEILYYLCSFLEYLINEDLNTQSHKQNANLDNKVIRYVKMLDTIKEYNKILSYNISSKNFYDSIFVSLKSKLDKG